MPEMTSAVTASSTNTGTKPLRQSNLWDPLLGKSECFMPELFLSGMFMMSFVSIDQVCRKTPENVKRPRLGTWEIWNPSYLCVLNLAHVKVRLDLKSSSPAWFLGEQYCAPDGRTDRIAPSHARKSTGEVLGAQGQCWSLHWFCSLAPPSWQERPGFTIAALGPHVSCSPGA